MGTGQLSERVRFERRARVSDGAGNTRAGWEPLPRGGVERWASLKARALGGGEQVLAGRLTGVSAWDLLVRRDSGTRQVTRDDRVVDARSGQTFAIRDIFKCDPQGKPMGDQAGHLMMTLQSGGADD